MLAITRCRLPLFLLLVLSLASVPLTAQVTGVPPSVTSFGFGGSTNPTPGPRASVTSLPNSGYGVPFIGNWGGNYFWPYGYWPSNSPTPLAPEHRRHHHHGEGVIAVPTFVPYAVPYAADDDDDSADYPEDYGASAGAPDASDDPALPDRQRNARRGSTSDGRYSASDLYQSSSPDSARSSVASSAGLPGDSGRNPQRGSGSQGSASADSGTRATVKSVAPEEPQAPVAAQPTTVLVFKDGHRSGVVNYAIIGDTLFDFADGHARKIQLADLDLPATQKANDDLGVDFKLPPASQTKSVPK